MFGISLASAGLINAVAVVVANEPITLLEIEKKKQQEGLSSAEAVNVLVDEKIKKQKIKELGIEVDEYELEERIEFVAKQNNLSVEELKEVLEARFMSWQEYRKDIKEAVINEKLSQKVLADELVAIEEEDVRIYYENNQEEYQTAKELEVVQYVSKDKNELERYTKNPLMLSETITSQEQTIATQDLNPKLATILKETKKGAFTPIFPAGDNFITFLVKRKTGEEIAPFESVQSRIREKLNQSRRAQAINSYFQKERTKVDIRVVRDF